MKHKIRHIGRSFVLSGRKLLVYTLSLIMALVLLYALLSSQFGMDINKKIIPTSGDSAVAYLKSTVLVMNDEKVSLRGFIDWIFDKKSMLAAQMPMLSLHMVVSATALDKEGDVKLTPNDYVELPQSSAIPQIKQSEEKQVDPVEKIIKDVTIAPKSASDTNGISGIYVNNDTSYPIDIAKSLSAKLNFSKPKGVQVLIVHTHTGEAYEPFDRSDDQSKGVVAVGKEIADVLKSEGIGVIHDTTVHDEPSFNQSYSKSLETIKSQIKANPSIQIVIDVHRDSMQQEDGTRLKPVVTIDGKKVAQVMTIVGTNQGGLDHPNWQQNLNFAMQLQQKENSLYENLMRPINLRRERFNENQTKGSILIEVGSDANTLEEAVLGGRYFSKGLAKLLK